MITLEYNLERLNQISKLEKDWNGYDAEPIDKIAIKNVEAILHHLTIQPEIYPTGRKTVQLQYEKPDGTYVEFEVYSNKIICTAVPGIGDSKRNYNSTIWYQILPDRIDAIKQILKLYQIENILQ